MPAAPQWHFASFRLDPATTCLWRDGQLVPLPPKAFAVLAYLVAHAGEVVTKETLLEAVWTGTVVSEGALKTCMSHIRRALGETGQTPQYIATVHRRGYRFVAPVTVEAAPAPPPQALRGPPVLCLAREAELRQLAQCWERAYQGTRQIVFITGEAGIGKTTLVDAFVAQIAAPAPLWSARGQCLEQYGAGEAYLPLLEALGHLGRGPDGTYLLGLLRQQAPSWLAQLPGLLSGAADDAPQRHSGGTTRERMLRELTETLETLTHEQPLILVLEDLHWSDHATLDWLAFVSHRRVAARLLVLGTYRPGEAVIRGHPVRTVSQELQRHGQATELLLGSLPEAGVGAYLAQRFGTPHWPDGFVRLLHQRTNGNPFFLATVVDDLVRRGVLEPQATGWTLRGEVEAVAIEVPESVRQLMEHQLAQVSLEEQELLAAASVVGTAFTAAAVAAGVGLGVEDLEARCDALARRGQFVRAQGSTEWPDGTVTACYSFSHDLYREVCYARVPVSRRARWHQQIGRRLEAGYGAQTREVATELAVHFTRGRDTPRAVRFLRYAGENALRRSAYVEARQHLTHALRLLQTLPDTPERTAQELILLTALGPAVMAEQGYAVPEAERVYARARLLCQHVGETSYLLPALSGLWVFSFVRGELATAHELAVHVQRLAQRTPTPAFRLPAHMALGLTTFHLGQLITARTHLEQGVTLATTQPGSARVVQDPGVTCLVYAAWTLWYLGYPVQALQHSDTALVRARALSPYNVAYALTFTALLHVYLHAARTVYELVEEAIALATAHGLTLPLALGTVLRGWAALVQGQSAAGLQEMRQGLDAYRATGALVGAPRLLILLAVSCGHAGQPAAGLKVLAEAHTLVEAQHNRCYGAELLRLKGELTLQAYGASVEVQPQVETCFRTALALARCQQARTLELRAAMSLSRLWQQQGKTTDACTLLAEVYHWFTEGFDTADLQQARALLQEWGV